ncbi:hypothetical protein HZH68_009724 [Vespula germanica]|uniref:Uncharacterized protein n=1 Tax=Vespula germanica TaxID=30212 RepID=A0A834N5G0_VESGE|nr:hypothetical protein HZH68_009724 [Vespula germanica]
MRGTPRRSLSYFLVGWYSSVNSIQGVKGLRYKGCESTAENEKRSHVVFDEVNETSPRGDTVSPLSIERSPLVSEAGIDHPRYRHLDPFRTGRRTLEESLTSQERSRNLLVSSITPHRLRERTLVECESNARSIHPYGFSNKRNVDRHFEDA